MELHSTGVIGEICFGIAILATIIFFGWFNYTTGTKFKEDTESLLYPEEKNSRKAEEFITGRRFVYGAAGFIIWVVVICSMRFLMDVNKLTSVSEIDATCSSHLENREELTTTKTHPCQSDKTQKK